jgi:hypothetical protein
MALGAPSLLTIFFIERPPENHKLLERFISWRAIEFKMKIADKYRNEVLVAIVAIIAYAVSVVNDFHTDDWVVLSLLRDGFSWSDFLSMENPGRFRPLANIFFALRYAVFHDHAAAYYLVNIALHVTFCVLLFRFLKKLGLPVSAALLSALIFGAYFQHYEAVLWLYGTIRILGATLWILSLWKLHDYIGDGRRRSFWAFAIISFLGLFVVEDLVVAPIGFVIFALFMAPRESRGRRLGPIAVWGVASLTVYFALRWLLIARPGITEEYYYPGLHVITKLWDYLEWMILPPPSHPYFSGFAARSGSSISFIWNAACVLLTLGLIGGLLFAFFRSQKTIKFFVILILLALVPALPLNYKVGSRNIYIPSIGLAAVGGYVISKLASRLGRPGKRILYGALCAFMAASIVAIWYTSLEYRRIQTLVSVMITDLGHSGIDLNQYEYVLLDHMPGRTIVGPAMIYRFNYRHDVIASNDPLAGRIDIKAAARDVYSKGFPFVVFDYRNGHLVEATNQYLESSRIPETNEQKPGM